MSSQVTKPKSALTFIFITLVIDIMGFGLIIPVIPNLIKSLSGGTIAEASSFASLLAFAYAGTQFVFAPILGNLSDRYGRRPVLLASIAGFAIDYIVIAFAPNLAWFFLARVIAGITGASISTAAAYIADISTPEDRAKNFGLIGAAFGLGFILGPALGGILGEVGLKVPFFASAGLCTANFIFGYFVLPESLPPENRRPFDWKRANPLGNIMQVKAYPQLKRLFLVLFLIYLGSHAVQSNWSFFTIERFGWSERTIGLSLGLAGLLVGLTQGVLIRYINPRIGNEKSVYLGLAMYSIGMFLFSAAYESWQMFAILIPYCLGGIAGPAAQAIIAGEVPSNQQGEVQGLNTALVSVSSIFGPLIMNNLFYFFTKKGAPIYFPGAPFFLAGILFLVGALLIYREFRKHNPKVKVKV